MDNQSGQQEKEKTEEEATPPKISIGPFLVSIREKNGISIKALSGQTRISRATLVALETESFKDLPNKVYCKGFVASYAKAMNEDPVKAVEIFNQTFDYHFPTQHNEIHPPIKELQKGHENNTSKYLFASLGILAFIGFIYFVMKNDSPVEQAPFSQNQVEKSSIDRSKETASATSTIDQDIVQTQKDIVPDEPKDEPQIDPSDIVEVSTTQVKNEVETENQESSTDSSILDLNINLRPFPATPLFTISNVDHQELRDRLIPPTQQEIDTDLQNVFIYASEGDSWLTYKIDDDNIRRAILREGRSSLLQGNTIRLFVGNLNALKIFYNNQLINAPSRTGVKSLVFPENQKSDFYLPLFVYPGDGTTMTSDEYKTILEEKENETI